MTKIKDIIKPAGKKGKKPTKPFAKGSIEGVVAEVAPLPKSGEVKRYILTSAQNNTYVHDGVWKNLLALAEYHHAKLFVGTFTYDQNSYGQMSVKQGKYKGGEKELWYDPKIAPFVRDERVQLSRGLVWCGEANIIPTAGDPLRGFETYESRNSAIFPHAKIALRTIASVGGSGAKFIYTTGTTTQRNYIQKRAGLIAEFHHTFGGLIVEVSGDGTWKVRQLDAEDETGTFYDLDLKVENGVVTGGHRVEAITFGDIHATIIDPTVLLLSATGQGNMIDTLRPKYVFIHDLIEGASVNHHVAHKPLERFKTELRGLSSVLRELQASAAILAEYYRPETKLVVVNSNHDRWLDRFLDEYDHQHDDVRNLEIFHDGNAARLRAARVGITLNVLEYLIQSHTEFRCPDVQFLDIDESFLICDKRIECGQHGDLGANGVRGAGPTLSKIGRRSNIGHSHTAGIWDGLYQAGTSTELRMGYNHGPSAWTHSHIITYPNGKRAIITMFEDAWRA